MNYHTAAAWLLMWCGHLVSLPMQIDAMSWLYPLYNRLMGASLRQQLRAGDVGPWKEYEPERQG